MMTQNNILVDTNLLIFAINEDSEKNKIAQRFIQENIQYLATAHQNICEALRVLTHPKFSHPLKIHDALSGILRITQNIHIIYPNTKTLHIALELIQQKKLTSNKIFDAYLAATAISNGISTIATDNVKDFTIFGINIINPFV